MKYYIKVFGCQMNQSDAERIATILEKYKIKSASSFDGADLIVLITCGVRQSAENRAYGQINNLHKKFQNKKIVLTGCLAHRKDVQQRIKSKIDLYFSINDFSKFENWIIENSLEIENSKLKISARNTCFKRFSSYLSITPKYSHKYTAFVPIMTGCNNFCSYCVVPYARGRECSRPAENILKEIMSLIKKGYKEIILLGQNVNSYQSKAVIENLEIKKLFQNSCLIDRQTKLKIKNSSKINFAKLLQLIEYIPGNYWLSFLTSHPKDMSDELIKTITKSKKICEYISLPVQSGDNEILRRMNRKYTIAHYKNLIKKIRTAYEKYKPKSIPAISTDIIVGFPGETKKQFNQTAELLREIKFDMAYIAQYSPRPETAAWNMKNNVSKAEKVRREKTLTMILRKTAFGNNKKYVGKTVEVLVDKRFDLEKFRGTARKGKVEPWKEKNLAHTRTQKKVVFHTNKKIPIGSFQKVKITKAKAFGLEGEII